MAIMEISISPRSIEGISISQHLAPAIAVIKRSGLYYEVHAMGTNVQGTTVELLRVAEQMHLASFSDEVQRVVTTIKIDERRDKEVQLASKVSSIVEELS